MIRILIPALFGFLLGAVLFKDMKPQKSTPVVTAPISAPAETTYTDDAGEPARTFFADVITFRADGTSRHESMQEYEKRITNDAKRNALLALASSDIYWAKKNYANSESTKRDFRQFMATYARGGFIQPDRVSEDDRTRAKAMSGNGHQLKARKISRPESLTTIWSRETRILGWLDPNDILHFAPGISHKESLFVKKQVREMSRGGTP